MKLHKEAEAISRRLNDPAGLQRSLGNQALILQDQGDLEGAMKLHKEAEAISRRLNDPEGLSRSLLNQGSLQAFKLSRHAEGLALVEEALRIAAQHGLGSLARQIEPILEDIRALLG